MADLADSQLARLVVERKLCTSNEVELVRACLNGSEESLENALIQQGYLTRSQIHRLTRSRDDDSLYCPAQTTPGFQIPSQPRQGATAVS